MTGISRREFLRLSTLVPAAALLASSCRSIPDPYDIAGPNEKSYFERLEEALSDLQFYKMADFIKPAYASPYADIVPQNPNQWYVSALERIGSLSSIGEEARYTDGPIDTSDIDEAVLRFQNAMGLAQIRTLLGFTPVDAFLDTVDFVNYFTAGTDSLGRQMSKFDLVLTGISIPLALFDLDAIVDWTQSVRFAKTTTKEGEFVYAATRTAERIMKVEIGTPPTVIGTVGKAEFGAVIDEIRAAGKKGNVVLEVGPGGRIANYSLLSNTPPGGVTIAVEENPFQYDRLATDYNRASRFADQTGPNSVLLGLEGSMATLDGLAPEVKLLRASFPYASGLGFFVDPEIIGAVVKSGRKLELVMNGDAVCELLRAGLAPDELYGFALAEARNFFGPGELHGIFALSGDSTENAVQAFRTFFDENKGAIRRGVRIRPHTDDYLAYRRLLMTHMGDYFSDMTSSSSYRVLTPSEYIRLGTPYSHAARNTRDVVAFVSMGGS